MPPPQEGCESSTLSQGFKFHLSMEGRASGRLVHQMVPCEKEEVPWSLFLDWYSVQFPVFHNTQMLAATAASQECPAIAKTFQPNSCEFLFLALISSQVGPLMTFLQRNAGILLYRWISVHCRRRLTRSLCFALWSGEQGLPNPSLNAPASSGSSLQD